MAIESVTYINDLNEAYPSSLEDVADGDDHLRNIKKVLRNTFPKRNSPENSYVSLAGASVSLLKDYVGNFIEVPSGTTITLPSLGSDWADYSFFLYAGQNGTFDITGDDTINGLTSLGYRAGNLYLIKGTSASTWKAYNMAGGVGIVSGTRMPFAQAAAPAGWTQDVSDNANNRMLRVVSSAGGGVGGSHSPILNNVVPAHTHGFTTGGISANHSHTGNTGYVSADHTHAINDPGHSHNMLAMLVGSGGSYYAAVSGGYQSSYQSGSAGAGTWTSGQSANHYHGFTTGTESQSHTHSGTTDNGSSQVNWQPRYVDMIICQKD